jgi:calcineurin-like phosphoesterase family protein
MKTWITADQHFGHRNIITLCGRPFESVETMDEAMVEGWNAVVGENDEVWCLGDFAYRCPPRRLADIFGRLSGRKRHLIRGNHDRGPTLQLRWTSVSDYAQIKIGTIDVILFHYAMRVWNKCHYGSWHLFGHSHGQLPPVGRSCDVGVDVWGFRPVSFDEIAASRSALTEG